MEIVYYNRTASEETGWVAAQSLARIVVPATTAMPILLLLPCTFCCSTLIPKPAEEHGQP